MKPARKKPADTTLPPASAKPPVNLSSLQEINKVLGASLELDRLLKFVLTTMLTQTQASSGSLLLYDDQRQELTIRASQGLSPAIVRNTRVKLGQGIAGTVAKNLKPLIIDDQTFFSLTRAKPKRRIKSSLSLPLAFNNKLIGVLNLNRVNRVRQFTPGDLEIMASFARESALAIHNAQLYIDAEEKIQYLFRFNVIGSALNSSSTQEDILTILVDCIQQMFPFDFFSLLLCDAKEPTQVFVSSRISLSPAMLKSMRDNLSLVATDIMKQKIRPRDLDLSVRSAPLLKTNAPTGRSGRRVNSFMSSPLIAKGKIIGMLSIYALPPEAFNQKHQQSLSTLATQAAVALENASLHRSLRQTYISTIKALAQAIEEKDEYTRGHSEQVSQYAVQIGESLGLPKSFLESLQIAGILHDIGKIGIPENILRKPGKLTGEEYDIIKMHPLIGKRILAPVDFFWAQPQPRDRAAALPVSQTAAPTSSVFIKTMAILQTTDVSQEIKTMIYHHHERMDGNGYPDRLQGEIIPIGARILAIADTFEAMTSDRPYRKAFPVPQAIKLLKECTPGQLDGRIVPLFISLIKHGKIKIVSSS